MKTEIAAYKSCPLQDPNFSRSCEADECMWWIDYGGNEGECGLTALLSHAGGIANHLDNINDILRSR